MARKYHKTIDFLILAAELVHQNKPVAASKALVKAAMLPGSRKALAELDGDQQKLQDNEQDAAPKDEAQKVARQLAAALSLEAADDDQDDNFGGDDDDEQDASEIEEAEGEDVVGDPPSTGIPAAEVADVDLENVELEGDDTDGQLMRDSVDKPAIDTTKAATMALAMSKSIRAKLHQRFAGAGKGKPAAAPVKKAVKK